MAELVVPKVDFSPLGDLGNIYKENVKRQQLSDLGRELAGGSIDYRQAAGRVADMGDITHTLQFLALAEAQKKQKDQLQASNDFKSAILPGYGGAVPPASPMPNPSPTVPNPMPVPGAKPMSLAALGPSTPKVQSTPRVVGDDEGVSTGLYDKPAAPGARPPVQVADNERNVKIPALIGAMSNPNLPQADKELAKTLLQHELSQMKPNERIEFLRGLKANPDLFNIEKELKAKTEINIDQKGEGELTKTLSKGLGERVNEIAKEGDTARNDLAMVGQLRDLGQAVKTGGPAAIQGWLAGYGIKVGDNVGAVEAYSSIVDKLTPSQRVPGSGASSDLDVKMFKNSLPKLINTPEGNEIIQNTLAGVAQYKLERAAIADRVQAGELNAKEGIKLMRDLPNPYENFKNFAKNGFRADASDPSSVGSNFADRFGAARPGNQEGARVVPSTKVEIDQSLANARARIARDPGSRNMVIQKLREAGLPTEGL
jgi:hypothetical protein